MTIEELRTKTNELEKGIEALIETFEKETQVRVSGIGCTDYEAASGFAHYLKVNVTIEIR